MKSSKDRDLLAWLDGHSERGRLLKEGGRAVANRKAATVWHEREIAWRDELIASVRPHYPSWADDLLYLGDEFERGRGEQKHLKYTGSKFGVSAQFHAARLYVLRDLRKELRSKIPPPKQKTGPKVKNMDKQVAEAKRLIETGAEKSHRAAAEAATNKFGHGDCASHEAGVDYVRKRISNLPRGINLTK